MSLKRKITKQLVVIGSLSIALTTVLTIIVYYSMFQKQIFSDLRTNAEFMKGFFLSDSFDSLEQLVTSDDIRITVIDQDGQVRFDSGVLKEQMENHRERPEINDAFANGEGKSIRVSSTVGKNTYYYAILLEDGYVLRVARKAQGLLSMFYSTIPVLLIGTIVLFGFCLITSHFFTRKIVHPIEQMASYIDHFEGFQENVPYTELIPFANTIWEQHQNIKSQMQDLEKSSKMRQEFTANVSHELKTPLTAISGYAELIESGMTRTEDYVHFGKEIHRNSERLLHLINDIIELSELDTTEIEVPKADIDIYEIAKNCVENLKISAQNHRVTITESGSSHLIHANHNMIEELITNLSDNAIRYNKVDGTVNVSVTAQNGFVELIVKDTGIGIPKEHITRIFERFYRVDKSRSKETGGTGLGLAIVKHIAAVNNGTIEVESEVGKGTKIVVKFEEVK